MAEHRVIVTGSRSWTDRAAVWRELDVVLAKVEAEGGMLVVVHGAARSGADAHAHAWCVERWHELRVRPVKEEPHRADWHKHGKAAGYLRNEAMISLGADSVRAFIMQCALRRCAGRKPHGTHGSTHCADLAVKAGIEVRRFGFDG